MQQASSPDARYFRALRHQAHDTVARLVAQLLDLPPDTAQQLRDEHRR
ncbi:hypothetical protein [Hymenobacter seoulensis]